MEMKIMVRLSKIGISGMKFWSQKCYFTMNELVAPVGKQKRDF